MSLSWVHFVLDSPSKVPFTSVLMAQLCVSRFGARKLPGSPLVPLPLVRSQWLQALARRGAGGGVAVARNGVACRRPLSVWARMPRQAGTVRKKSGRASKKSAVQSALPAGAFGGVCRGEWVCPGYICSGPSLQSSFHFVLGAHWGVSRFGAQKSQSSNSAVIRHALMRLCSARRRSRFLSISPDFMSSSLLSRHFLSPLPAFLRL